MSVNIPYSAKKRVVIVGGGFAGLTLARRLSGKNFQVILIDRNNYHQFPPLIYQESDNLCHAYLPRPEERRRWRVSARQHRCGRADHAYALSLFRQATGLSLPQVDGRHSPFLFLCS